MATTLDAPSRTERTPLRDTGVSMSGSARQRVKMKANTAVPHSQNSPRDSRPEEDALTRLIAEKLRQVSPVFGSIEIGVSDDTVTLGGQVGRFYHKQLAQESIKHLLGDRVLRNELRVG